MVGQDRRERVRRALPLERSSASQHLIEDDAEGEDVRPRVDPGAPRLFRRHVGDRAEDLALARQVHSALRRSAREVGTGARGLEPGQAEIQHLDAPLARHHDVAGLQVAMHDAARVRRRQRVGERHGDLEEAGEG